MSHELTITYVVTVSVDDCKDYTKSQDEIDDIADKISRLYAPDRADDVISIDIDEYYWSSGDPRPEELNPFPAPKYYFMVNDQPWVANAISAFPVAALDGQEPLEPWIEWSEKQPTKIIELIQKYHSMLPKHPGRFSEIMTAFIGDLLVLGTAKDGPGYIIDDGNLVGIIMPVLDKKPKN